MLTGENGILNRAQEAKDKTSEAQEDENKKIQNYVEMINRYAENLPIGEGTTPYIPNSTFSYKEGDLSTGLVIEDSDNNEYVWVEVPTTIYENTVYNSNGTKKPSNSEDYANIEACLKAYTSDYSDSSYSDTNSDFATQYQAMLKSVYTNGGFWIGRYEAGLEAGKNPRTTHIDIADNDKAEIKPNAYPYNCITRNEAQTLAQKKNYENCKTSLLFGVQWDLMLKYIETKNKTTQENLQTNSCAIGNYYNTELIVNRGKFAQYGDLLNWYNFDGQDKSSLVNMGKKQFQSLSSNAILLTTGASNATSLQNIYDIAGNVHEWTLEFFDDSLPCVGRGGSYISDGSIYPAKYRDWSDINNYNTNIGFRIGLWK